MSREYQFGQFLLRTDEQDAVDLGWNPEERRARIITRTPEQVRMQKGSLVSIELTVDQLRALVVTGAHLLDMVENQRQPGDRPVPEHIRESRGTVDIDAPADVPNVSRGVWKGDA